MSQQDNTYDAFLWLKRNWPTYFSAVFQVCYCHLHAVYGTSKWLIRGPSFRNTAPIPNHFVATKQINMCAGEPIVIKSFLHVY